jgi:hypothetical protein
MLDQVVMQRLLRRPDRLMTLVDTTGMSHDDAHWFIEDMKRRMHREFHLNPSGSTQNGSFGQFTSTGFPNDDGNDMVMSRGPNNQTSIENFPATNQNDLLRDLDMMYNNLANGVGFPHGFMRGEGRYNPEQSLSRQHQPFAKRAARLQRAYLHETVKMCMIDMAYQGLDPTLDEHQFSLQMAPVSPILEIERHEVVSMKIDRLERALRLGMDNQFDQSFWVPFVLRTYGGFPDDVVKALYSGAQGAEGDNQVNSQAFAFEQAKNGNGKRNGAMPNRQYLEEAIKAKLPPVNATKPTTWDTVSVMESLDVDPKALRSEGALSIEAWKKADRSTRASATPARLLDTTEPSTRIVPVSDDEAKRVRESIRESRAKVAEKLLHTGNVFNLKPVGSYGRRRG